MERSRQIICTSHVSSNADVSGIGIVLAVFVQGFFNQTLLAFYWTLVYFFPDRRNILSEWCRKCLEDRVSWTMGIGVVMLISTFSQWTRLSVYHIEKSFLLVNATTSGCSLYVQHALDGRVVHRSKSFFFIASTVLYFGLLIAFNMRLDKWSNDAGDCFYPWIGSLGTIGDRDALKFWLWVFAGVSVFQIVVAVPLAQRYGTCFKTPPSFLRKVETVISFFFVVFFDLFMLSVKLHWIIENAKSNEALIDGSESEWSFGQVAAVVAVGLVLYRFYKDLKKYKHGQDILPTSNIEFIAQERSNG